MKITGLFAIRLTLTALTAGSLDHASGSARDRCVYRQSHVLGQRCHVLDHLFDDPDQFLAKTLRLLFNGVSGT